MFTTVIPTKKNPRRYSNSDDSSQSHDENDVVRKELRGSLDIKPQNVSSSSHKSSVRGSIKESYKVEMRDFRASEEEKVRSLPNKSKVTGAILNNQSAEEVKSASSFNRSFNKSDGMMQDSPEINKEVLNRVTSNFGIPIGGEEEDGNASPLFINKASRTATILN